MSESEQSDKQAIKIQRVKSYFIDAAREIILDEGVENVSVRKVADRAGYAFTTIYNYFTDMNDLLRAVKNKMIADVMVNMQRDLPEQIRSIEDLKKTNLAYVRHYLENPNIYHFFYNYRLNEVSTEPELPDFESHWHKTYGIFVEQGILRKEEVPIIAKTFIYSIQGLLALYFSDNGMTEDKLIKDLDAIVDFLLKRVPMNQIYNKEE